MGGKICFDQKISIISVFLRHYHSSTSQSHLSVSVLLPGTHLHDHAMTWHLSFLKFTDKLWTFQVVQLVLLLGSRTHTCILCLFLRDRKY